MESIKKALNIKQGEGKKVILTFFYYFCLGSYVSILESVSYASFNLKVGTNMLPLIFVVFPIINVFISFFIADKISKVNKRLFFKISTLIIMLIHFCGYLVVDGIFQEKIYYFIFLLSAISIIENLDLIMMFLIQELYNNESLKRLVPIATCGGAIGAISAGGILRISTEFIRTEDIFLFALVILFIKGSIIDTLLKKYRVIKEKRKFGRTLKPLDIFNYLKKESFFIILTVTITLIAVSAIFLNYLFNRNATAVLTNMSDLTSYLGTYVMLRYSLNLIMNMFVFSKTIQRFGAFNMMKAVILTSLLCIFAMIFSHNYLYLGLFAVALFRVLVVDLSTLLLQLYFQMVDPKYKNSLLTFLNTTVLFVGYTVGGGILIFQTMGYFEAKYFFIFLLISIILNILIWIIKQHSFVSIMNGNLNLASGVSIREIFGTSGIKTFLPTLQEKSKSGNKVAKKLLIEFVKNFEVDEKEEILKREFLNGDKEIKMNIIKTIINEKLYSFNIENILSEMDIDMQKYLTENIFFNILEYKKNNLIKPYLKDEYFYEIKKDEYFYLLIDFIKYQNEQNYKSIIDFLLKKEIRTNYNKTIKVIKKYHHTYQNINQKYLKFLMTKTTNLKDIEILELFADYDKSITDEYFPKIIQDTKEYKQLDKLVEILGFSIVIEKLKQTDSIINSYAILHTSKYIEQNRISDLYSIFSKQILHLRDMISERNLIAEQKKVNGIELLLNELDRYIVYFQEVLVNYLLLYYKIPLIDNIGYHLKNTEQKQVIIEIIKNSVPIKDSEIMISILEENIAENSKCDYQSMKIGDKEERLYNLSRYIMGAKMENNFGEDIDKMIVLKSIPMFSELDIDILYELVSIAKYRVFKDGEVLVKKGELGEDFFVIQSGEVGVSLEDGKEFIAKVGKGGIIGELGIINHDVRTATVSSIGESYIMEFDGEDFINLVKKDSNVAFSVIKTLSARLSAMLHKK